LLREGHDARQLDWMHARRKDFNSDHPPDSQDLLPGIPFWADVVWTEEGGSKWPRLSCFPDLCLPFAGDYVVTVQASADEACEVAIDLLISWDGSWDSLTGRVITPEDRARLGLRP
jgi:hypothetical protein